MQIFILFIPNSRRIWRCNFKIKISPICHILQLFQMQTKWNIPKIDNESAWTQKRNLYVTLSQLQATTIIFCDTSAPVIALHSAITVRRVSAVIMICHYAESARPIIVRGISGIYYHLSFDININKTDLGPHPSIIKGANIISFAFLLCLGYYFCYTSSMRGSKLYFPFAISTAINVIPTTYVSI